MDTVNSPNSAVGIGEQLAGFAVRKPVTVCMFFLLVAVMGAVAVQRVPLMLLPEFETPTITVVADYPNATPDQVLEAITKPVEDAIATVPGVQRINSRSTSTGMSIQIVCSRTSDISMIRSDVRDKIDQIRNSLPEDLREVEVRKFSTLDFPILEGVLTADRDLTADHEYLVAKVRSPIERLPGVGDVDVWGANPKQVSIRLRVDDVKRHGVDVSRLYRELEASNLDVSLGQVSEGTDRYTVMLGRLQGAVEGIESYPIGHGGLVLGDVADVVLDERPRDSGRRQNGKEAVGISIHKTTDANTVEVVDRVNDTFARWAEDPSMEGITARWDENSGDEIRNGIGEIVKSGVVGAILASLVLLAFLRRLDASLTVGFAIPFSVLAAVGFLYFNGNTLNIMTMMGLMLATGMLVDNAIVVLESIVQKIERGMTPDEAARRGAGEVTVAVIAATSTTIIIFVPLMFESDSQISRVLGQVGVSVIFALLASLFLSLTLIPLVAAKLIRPSAPSSRSGREPAAPSAILQWAGTFLARIGGRPRPPARAPLMRRYLGLVRWHVEWRYPVGLILVPAVLGVSTWALLEIVPNNSPEAEVQSSLRLEYEFSENYHHAKIEQDFVNPVEAFLHANMDRLKLKATASSYGNGQAWTRAYLDPDKVRPVDIPGIMTEIREGLPTLPGSTIEVGQESGGDRNRISASLYGDDPEMLRELASQAKRALLQTDGFSEVRTELSDGRSEVKVRLRRDTARRYGISPEELSQVLGITVRSTRMRSFATPNGEIELWLGLDPSDMQSVEDLESLIVGRGAGGEQILLGSVADLTIDAAPSLLTRENRQTFAEIHASYVGQRLEDGREAVRSIFDELPYEAGYDWTFGFLTSRQSDEMVDFVFNMALALVMVYFVMAALFESVLHPFAIMFALPFSAVGIVAFLLLTGTPFNLMAQVGIILLIGIVVNNGIVLINHVNNIRREGIERSQAVLRGCEERLRPICMTAATTIMGLMPLALGGGTLMGNHYFPLARTVMGGLMASTVLTLVVLPTYYVILDDLGDWIRKTWAASDPT